jgi:hypothetical protein
MQAVIVFRRLYKVPEFRWNRHLVMDGSGLADLRRKGTLTDRKKAKSPPLNTIHRKSVLNQRLDSRTVVAESK